MSLLDIFKVDCHRATYLHEKDSEGKLSMGEKLGVMIHLAYCRFCRRFIRQVRQIEKAVKTLSDNNEKLDSTVKNNIQRAFDDELRRQ